MVCSIPLAAGALIAARPFARAAVRYRVLAAAFVLVAAVGPLAFAAATLRDAPPSPAGFGPPAAGALAPLALPVLALAAVVAAALLLVLTFDVVRLRRVKRGAVPLGTVAVRRARIGVSPTVVTPTAIGYLHPAVVLPEGFRDRVDAREWDAVLAHECAHLARCDDWAKAFQSAVVRAGWWLPGLWILSRALDLERELASDERAAAETGPRRYAACLLRLATARGTDGTDAVAPGLWGRRSHVAIRVERLLRPVTGGGPLLRAGALGAFTGLSFALAGAAVLAVPGTVQRAVPAAPRHAQAPSPQIVVAARTAPRPAARAVGTNRPAVPSHTVSLAEPVRVAVHAAEAAALPVAPPRAAAVRAVAAVVVVPARRAPARRPGPIRMLTPEVLAYAVRQPRCATCFGPLRSPDVAVPAPASAFASASGGGAAGGASAIAAGDPGSGPVDLNSGLVWYRLPARAVALPFVSVP